MAEWSQGGGPGNRAPHDITSGELMHHRASRKSATIRAVSLALLPLCSVAVLYSVYQVAAGHAAFSWAWLVALLPAIFGTYLLASCALEGRRPATVETAPGADAAG